MPDLSKYKINIISGTQMTSDMLVMAEHHSDWSWYFISQAGKPSFSL